MKKEYLVVCDCQVGSKFYNQGIKRFVWGHYKTKKLAVEWANKLKTQFTNVEIQIKTRA